MSSPFANLSLLAPWQNPTLSVYKWVLSYQIPFQGGRVPGKPGSHPTRNANELAQNKGKKNE